LGKPSAANAAAATTRPATPALVTELIEEILSDYFVTVTLTSWSVVSAPSCTWPITHCSTQISTCRTMRIRSRQEIST
jgi:hypothetical protein